VHSDSLPHFSQRDRDGGGGTGGGTCGSEEWRWSAATETGTRQGRGTAMAVISGPPRSRRTEKPPPAAARAGEAAAGPTGTARPELTKCWAVRSVSCSRALWRPIKAHLIQGMDRMGCVGACGLRALQHVRSAYQPPANSTFLSEQTSHRQSASSTFLSEQISTSHRGPFVVLFPLFFGMAMWAMGNVIKFVCRESSQRTF
jgi:hypothetical protein